MKTIGIAFLGLIACLANPTQAASTFGNPDCGQWLNEKSIADKSWLLGYVSGISQMQALNKNGRDPLGQVNTSGQIYVWMDNYCQKNPLNKVHNGANELFIELMKRQK